MAQLSSDHIRIIEFLRSVLRDLILCFWWQKAVNVIRKILRKLGVYELHQLLILCGSTKMMKYTDMLQMHILFSYCCGLCEVRWTQNQVNYTTESVLKICWFEDVAAHVKLHSISQQECFKIALSFFVASLWKVHGWTLKGSKSRKTMISERLSSAMPSCRSACARKWVWSKPTK